MQIGTTSNMACITHARHVPVSAFHHLKSSSRTLRLIFRVRLIPPSYRRTEPGGICRKWFL